VAESRVPAGLPPAVREVVRRLPAEHQELFRDGLRRRQRSLLVAYLTWVVGWHYAYLGRWGLLVVFLVTAGGLGVWWLVDAVRLPGLVAAANRTAAVRALEDVRTVLASERELQVRG
jgi:hypothetical protein